MSTEPTTTEPEGASATVERIGWENDDEEGRARFTAALVFPRPAKRDEKVRAKSV